jgi:hypothetical protein
VQLGTGARPKPRFRNTVDRKRLMKAIAVAMLVLEDEE